MFASLCLNEMDGQTKVVCDSILADRRYPPTMPGFSGHHMKLFLFCSSLAPVLKLKLHSYILFFSGLNISDHSGGGIYCCLSLICIEHVPVLE